MLVKMHDVKFTFLCTLFVLYVLASHVLSASKCVSEPFQFFPGTTIGTTRRLGHLGLFWSSFLLFLNFN